MIRDSDVENPDLRRQVIHLATARNHHEMCRGFGDILARMGNRRQECPTGLDDFVFHFEEVAPYR
jgi:hypothetical protein